MIAQIILYFVSCALQVLFLVHRDLFTLKVYYEFFIISVSVSILCCK